MPLRAVIKKGCAPAVRLVAGSELIDRDGPDLQPANRAAAFCGRGALGLANEGASGPCDNRLSKSDRELGLSWHSSDYRGR